MPDNNDALAEKVRDFIRAADEPHSVTVQEIAAALGVSVEEAVEVFDTYVVNGSGDVSYVGDGAGGGWVPTPPPEAVEGE